MTTKLITKIEKVEMKQATRMNRNDVKNVVKENIWKSARRIFYVLGLYKVSTS